jgi:hypothetical protein
MTDRCTVSNPSTVSSSLGYNPSPNEPLERLLIYPEVNAHLSSNEGSEQLTNPTTDQTFLIYSAGRPNSRNYCLRQLELVGADSVKA